MFMISELPVTGVEHRSFRIGRNGRLFVIWVAFEKKWLIPKNQKKKNVYENIQDL